MKTARLIVTFDCPRRCVYCCNRYDTVMQTARKVDKLEDLAGYDEVILTGGEPQLYPEKLVAWVARYYTEFDMTERRIYLYTTLFVTGKTPTILDWLDGAEFTLHDDATHQDIGNFLAMQAAIEPILKNRPFSSRLTIFSNVNKPIPLQPNIWGRVRVIHPRPEAGFKMPEHEDLLIWTGEW